MELDRDPDEEAPPPAVSLSGLGPIATASAQDRLVAIPERIHSTACDGNLVDLDRAQVIGHCEGRWLAIDTRGRCLTYAPDFGTPLDVDRHLQWRPAAR